MKLFILTFITAIAAFCQDAPKYSVGAGVDNSVFVNFGVRLSDSLSTYTEAHVGAGAVLSQGLSFNILKINDLRMDAAGDLGVTSRGQFATSLGFLPRYDISKLTHVSGLSIVGHIQMQRIGSMYAPNIGIGLSKSF